MAYTMTKAQKVEQFDGLKDYADRFMLGVHDLMNDRVTWSKWICDGNGGKYRVGLSRWDVSRLMFTAYKYENQDVHTEVYWYEHEYQNLLRLRSGSDSWQPLIEALSDARSKIEALQSAA